jgi:oligopeptidase B
MTSPPRAKKHHHSFTQHGVTIADDYAWLRAENWQQVMREPETLDADIRDYLEAENAYLKDTLSDTDAAQASLFDEMKARIKEDDSSVPSPDGPWSYYSSFVTGGQYPRFCRCPRGSDSGGADEAILLDGNKEAQGHDFWQLGSLAHSPDHKLMAYGVDTAGSEYYTLRFRDIEAGKGLEYISEVAIFLGVLGFGLLYAWRKGVLDWNVRLGESSDDVVRASIAELTEEKKAA